MPTPHATPYLALREATARDGAAPILTTYDLGSGARVELSRTTLENGVVKTAGLLREELELEPGDRLLLRLPVHWQAVVWACAAWAVGVEVVLPGAGDAPAADAVVVGPDGLGAAERAVASGTPAVACALRPLGGRFTDPLPPGVLDHGVEAPNQPDRLMLPPAGDATAPALEVDGISTTARGLLVRAGERAADLGLATGARLLVAADAEMALAAALGDALLVPLIVQGSAVLATGFGDPSRSEQLALISSQEHVDARLGQAGEL